jgi:two-component system NtrC family sensor kinase
VLVSTLETAAQQRDLAPELQRTTAAVNAGSEAQKILLGGEHFFLRKSPMNPADPRMSYALLSSYEQPFQVLRDTQNALLWVRIFGVTLAALILWALIKRVTQPLRELRDGAEAVGRGDFSRRVRVSTTDELGDLAKSFNEMTLNLNASRTELEQTVNTLKTTRAQLVQSEKLSIIGEFVAGVAHELNNPLTGVVGYAQLLNDSDVDLVTQKTYSRRIVQSAMRCQRIVQNLLSFARQHPPERRAVNLNDVLESVVDLLQYELRTSNIEVTKRFASDLPSLMGDGHQLQQVFLNIINNARQAMEGRPDSSIVITTERSDTGVRLVFQDNGPGISSENLSRIFDPFFTTKDVGKGTGLGLSLSYGIIQEHGGRISARSEPGKGAAFIIDLPIMHAVPVASPTAPTNSSKTSSHIGAGKRLLAVDDEEHILQLARDILQAEGYHVDIASDGEAALKQLSERKYDLILCDIKMPGMSGEQFFERVRGEDNNSAERIIFMTGDVMSPSTDQFLKNREKRCISKPFSPTELRAAVHESSTARTSI